MDLVKIGKFIQELRKEKGLTQEQLAEQMGVARRTVSRWETGNNMPDLDILVELSDLYEVDLREILNGERKSEQMNKVHGLFIAGLIGFAVFLVITLAGLDKTAPFEAIGSVGLGLAFGMIVIGVIFTGRNAMKIREFKQRLLQNDRKDG